MPAAGILSVLAGAELSGDLDRVAAAAGLRIAHQSRTLGLDRRAWEAATVIVVDADGARRAAARGMPRRPGIVVACAAVPGEPDYRAAVSVGAQQVLRIPAEDTTLLRVIADAVRAAPRSAATGAVLAVVSGHGGAGGSLFATALAHGAGTALLVDLDRHGPGIDLMLGRENQSGLRWPDIVVQEGGLDWDAVRAALPGDDGVSVLSHRRGSEKEIPPGAVSAVLEAGSRGGATVICDVPRWPGSAGRVALAAADLVVVLGQATVGGAAGSAATARAMRAGNPNVGLVVRGPAPGGLRAEDVAAAAGVPLLAGMRPEPKAAQRLERGALRPRPGGPLGRAAAAVLTAVARASSP